MLTEYDIQRTAKAVVDLLLDDDRFLRRVTKIGKKRSRLLNSAQAADALGISKVTLRRIAQYIGGIRKGTDKYQHWCFEEEGLKERYIEYLNENK